MPDGSNVERIAIQPKAFVYDGSLDGLLTVVFFCLENRITPLEIRSDEYTMIPSERFETDFDKANRLMKGIKKRVCTDAAECVKLAYLSGAADKGVAVLEFLRVAFAEGEKAMYLITLPEVARLFKIVKAVEVERRMFVQFIRFSEIGGYLVSEIEPEHNILPLIAEHFVDRLPNEKFVVYDSNRNIALFYDDKKLEILPVDEFNLPTADENELKYEKLWKLFYKTVAIKERESKRRRMGHMPKKFWKHMLEVDDELRK